jgi:GNAT superfamily N-acetyltransferase
MQIREANPSDLEAIANLHARSWRIAYRGILSDAYLDGDLVAERRALWRERFHQPAPNQTIVVVEIDGDIVGLACAFGDHDARWGTLLENLHVAPGHKGAGIGAQLVRHIAAWSSRAHTAAGMHLWVLAGNTAAQGFYGRLGASQVEASVWDAPDGNSVSEFRFAWPRVASLLQDQQA